MSSSNTDFHSSIEIEPSLDDGSTASYTEFQKLAQSTGSSKRLIRFRTNWRIRTH
jgi:hypothetical protein